MSRIDGKQRQRTKDTTMRNLFDLIQPQHSIVIGNRSLRRGAMLQGGNFGKSAPRVNIGAACGECGVAIGQCSCSAMPTAAAYAPPSDLPSNLPPNIYTPAPGCFPAAACDSRGMFRTSTFSEALRNSRMRQAPYVDPAYDSMFMDTIVSDLAAASSTVAAGASGTVELLPVAGTFALFYWEIVAVDPTTQVQQVDWRAGTPRVEGCPVPCGAGDRMMLPAFIQKVPEACCGQPLVAWLDRPSEDTPLQVPVQNNQAAGDLLFQVRGRGYCCSTRIC